MTQRTEAKRARRRARLAGRPAWLAGERMASLMLAGQDSWARATGLPFPTVFPQRGAPRR